MFLRFCLVFPANFRYNKARLIREKHLNIGKGWGALRIKGRIVRVAFLCFLLAFTTISLPFYVQGSAEEDLPVCADVVGVYLQAERAEPGARLLSSYLNSFTTVTARMYTAYSRSKLYIFQTIVSTPYAGNAAFNPYFEEVTQTAPYVFEDRKGIEYVFEVNDAGEVTELRIEGERWVPSSGLASAAGINGTILALQLLCLYSLVALFFTALFALRHRRAHWVSLAPTRLNTALTFTQAAALVVNAVLLIGAVPSLPYESLRGFFLLNVAFMITLPALSLGVILSAPKGELELRQKLCYALNVACALLLFALMVAWQLYH